MLGVHKGLAVTLLLAVFCTSAVAEDGISGLAMDEIVGKIYDPGKPVNYEVFREIGLRDFHQVSSSRSLNIAFRSNAFKTRDQYGISFIEFRVPPELDKGVSFMCIWSSLPVAVTRYLRSSKNLRSLRMSCHPIPMRHLRTPARMSSTKPILVKRRCM